MDYLASRQNPVENVDREELNALLASIELAFGEFWLDSDGEAPLQKLWKRRDALATNQLFLIGDAVKSLTAIDKNWVKKHVSTIKSKTSSNRRGAMFELLGLNIFASAGLQVRPTKKNAAGFDGVITLPDQTELALSLKSHGPSTFEIEVGQCAEAVEKLCVEALEQQRISGWKFVLQIDAYPTAGDWNVLIEQLPAVLWRLPQDKGITKIGAWTFVAKRLFVEPDVQFADSPPSYEFQIIAGHHKNEARNLDSKLDGARANLEEHAKNAPPHRRHGVLMRLHENASAAQCVEWVKECLARRPGSPLAAVFLYQAATVRNLQSNTSSIGHTIVPVAAPGFEAWLATAGGLVGRFIVGTVQREPTPMAFWMDGVMSAPLDAAYLYQRGRHYHLLELTRGEAAGSLSSVAPGIHQHVIVRMPGQPGHLEIQRIDAATEELTMFD